MNAASGSVLSRILASLACLAVVAPPLAAETSSNSASAVALPRGYRPGETNLLGIRVQVVTNATAEYVDNIYIDFGHPSGVGIDPVFLPLPFAGCGAGTGNAAQLEPDLVTLTTPNHPSGCGAFDGDSYLMTFNVTPPVGYDGVIVASIVTEGDGWPPPLTDPDLHIFAVSWAPGLFFDGFELANTCAWSVTVGGPGCV